MAVWPNQYPKRWVFIPSTILSHVGPIPRTSYLMHAQTAGLLLTSSPGEQMFFILWTSSAHLHYFPGALHRGGWGGQPGLTVSSLISNACHGYGQGRRRRVLYFSTLFQALTGVFILRKCYQIEPPNVVLRSFPLYAQELTSANRIRYTHLGLQQL